MPVSKHGISPKIWRRLQREKKREPEKRSTVKDTIKSFASKYMIHLLIALFGFGGFFSKQLYDQFISNKKVACTLQIQVFTEDSYGKLSPLENAQVYVNGRKDRLNTNDLGQVDTTLEIRKLQDTLILVCGKEGFEFDEKKVFVPVDGDRIIPTKFVLKPKGPQQLSSLSR